MDVCGTVVKQFGTFLEWLSVELDLNLFVVLWTCVQLRLSLFSELHALSAWCSSVIGLSWNCDFSMSLELESMNLDLNDRDLEVVSWR